MCLKRNFILFSLAFLTLFAAACVGDGANGKGRKLVNEAIAERGIYAQVLIPAGETTVGTEQMTQSDFHFLPYPGNWSAIVSPSQTDLNAIVLCNALQTGSILSVEVVGVLQLDSMGTRIDVIVAVPTDTTLRSVELGGFVDLITDQEPIRHILQTWFVNHRGFGTLEVLGWRDEEYALSILK